MKPKFLLANRKFKRKEKKFRNMSNGIMNIYRHFLKGKRTIVLLKLLMVDGSLKHFKCYKANNKMKN